MCKLIYGTKPVGKPEIDNKIRDILQLQYKELKAEKDGASAIIINKNNEIERSSSLHDYEGVFEFLEERLPKAKFFGVHTRTGTTGDVDVMNCHFFEKDGLVLAHNGIVSNFSKYGFYYSSGKKGKSYGMDVLECEQCQFKGNGDIIYCDEHGEDDFTNLGKEGKKIGKVDMCDSYQFLHAIREKAKKEKLNSSMLASSMNLGLFNGMAVLLDLRNKSKAHYYTLISSTKAGYMVTDEENYSVMFSYKPTTSGSKDVSDFGDFGGVRYKKKVETIKYDLGVSVYDIDSGYAYVSDL